jgi:hypothetical protein
MSDSVAMQSVQALLVQQWSNLLIIKKKPNYNYCNAVTQPLVQLSLHACLLVQSSPIIMLVFTSPDIAIS